VLRLIAEGLKYEEIAARLFLSINTVRTYVKEIYSKLDVNNRTKAIALARDYGLI
jgi:LuxR family maltose regulon positive regulatory protein